MTGWPILAHLRDDIGLTLGLRRGRRSLAVGLAAGALCGAMIGLADLSLFRTAVPASQLAMTQTVPLMARLIGFARGALLDEIALRLVGMTGLIAVIGSLNQWRDPARVAVLAIGMAATVLWPLRAIGYLSGLDWGALVVARELCLHVSAGAVWGWLYWRHGWLAGVFGHCAAHLILQPVLALGA